MENYVPKLFLKEKIVEERRKNNLFPIQTKTVCKLHKKSPEFRCKANADVLVADQPFADIKSQITIYFVFDVIKYRSAFGGGRRRFRWRLHSD